MSRVEGSMSRVEGNLKKTYKNEVKKKINKNKRIVYMKHLLKNPDKISFRQHCSFFSKA